MALNKREKMIAIGLGAALLIGGLDYYAIEPYFTERTDVAQKLATQKEKMKKAESLITNQPRIDSAWKKLLASGLKTTPSEAESATQHAMLDWAQKYNVTYASLKSDQAIQDGDFQQVRFSATVNGRMGGISQLLYNIETSGLPMQLGDVRINSLKDGTDELTSQFTVTAIVYAPQATTTKPVRRTAAKEQAK